MLTEYEAQKLMREERPRSMQELKHEPAYVVAVILKCAAGLLIIAGVALFGAKTDLDRNAFPDGAEVPRREHASLAHGKKLPEERQSRLESSRDASGTVIRSAHSDPAVSAKVPEPPVDEGTPSRGSESSTIQQSSASPYLPQFKVDPYSK